MIDLLFKYSAAKDVKWPLEGLQLSCLKSCPHLVPGNQCLGQHKMVLSSHLEYSM